MDLICAMVIAGGCLLVIFGAILSQSHVSGGGSGGYGGGGYSGPLYTPQSQSVSQNFAVPQVNQPTRIFQVPRKGGHQFTQIPQAPYGFSQVPPGCTLMPQPPPSSMAMPQNQMFGQVLSPGSGPAVKLW